MASHPHADTLALEKDRERKPVRDKDGDSDKESEREVHTGEPPNLPRLSLTSKPDLCTAMCAAALPRKAR